MFGQRELVLIHKKLEFIFLIFKEESALLLEAAVVVLKASESS